MDVNIAIRENTNISAKEGLGSISHSLIKDAQHY
jgi:hypothetical protein